MAKYVLTNKAVEDLIEIWNYTFDTWSEKQADKYYNELLKEFQNLSENPEKGKIYTDLFDNLMGFKINKHIIFYREIDIDKIEVERILHERMDLKTNLGK